MAMVMETRKQQDYKGVRREAHTTERPAESRRQRLSSFLCRVGRSAYRNAQFLVIAQACCASFTRGPETPPPLFAESRRLKRLLTRFSFWGSPIVLARLKSNTPIACL
jgi:hypothetical protein